MDAKRKKRPAQTLEAREDQLIAMATDLAAERMAAGTASAQVVTHYLRLGTVKAKLELEKLEHENELLQAKTEALQSAKRVEELYAEALQAIARYSGQDDGEIIDE